MAGRYEEIFVPEMTVEHPVNHFNVFGMNVTLDGREAAEVLTPGVGQTARAVHQAAAGIRLVGGEHGRSVGTISARRAALQS
jgi:hypothetical protein